MVISERLYDDDGQPPRQFYSDRVDDRLVAEMLGLVKGVLADGVVNDGEAVAFAQWLRSHPEAAARFPGNLFAERLQRIFADGIIEEDEREELSDVMRRLVGEPEDGSSELDRATAIAYDNPLPTLLLDGWEYVFTGKFAYGSRKRCEQCVIERGGRVAKAVGPRTDVLVIGLFGSAAWAQSTYGTKILDALDAKASGHKIKVVPEHHWVATIDAY